MEFRCYTDWDQLPESADALFAAAEKESLFFSRPWFENLVAAALEENQGVLIACVLDEGRMLAALPLMKRPGETWHSLSNYYTSLYRPLLAQSRRQEEALSCLVGGLLKLPFQVLRLHPLAEQDADVERLRQRMESSGFKCYPYFRFYNWIYRLQGQSFEEYMAGRPGRVRSTIARKQRKLEREHGCKIRLFIRDDLDRAVSDYKTVYEESWKANESFSGFVDELVVNMARSGWLRLAILYSAEKPVAAQIWLVVHRKASIFRLVYDEAWKRYSPGSILTRYLMQYVIETDKVEELDFLTGNERYKQDWMLERRERWGLICEKPQQTGGSQGRILDKLKGLLKMP